MPRYFFDVPEGAEGSGDTGGVELPDRSTANNRAIRLLGDMVIADPISMTAGGTFIVHVTNGNDGSLTVVRLDIVVNEG